MRRPSICMKSQLAEESCKHCSWSFHYVLVVWIGIFGIFSYVTSESFTMTWCATLWDKGAGAFSLYESKLGDLNFFMQHCFRCGPIGTSFMDPQDLFQNSIPAEDALQTSQAGSASWIRRICFTFLSLHSMYCCLHRHSQLGR